MSELKAGRERVRVWMEYWPVVALVAGLLLSLVWTAGLAYVAFEILIWAFGD